MPAQNNITPSSISAIQIEENPSSRNSQSYKINNAKSPNPTPRDKKSQQLEEEPKSKEKSVHEKVSTPLVPRVKSPQKSKSKIESKAQQIVEPEKKKANEKLKLPVIPTKQKTDVKIPNKLKRQVKQPSLD